MWCDRNETSPARGKRRMPNQVSENKLSVANCLQRDFPVQIQEASTRSGKKVLSTKDPLIRVNPITHETRANLFQAVQPNYEASDFDVRSTMSAESGRRKNRRNDSNNMTAVIKCEPPSLSPISPQKICFIGALKNFNDKPRQKSVNNIISVAKKALEPHELNKRNSIRYIKDSQLLGTISDIKATTMADILNHSRDRPKDQSINSNRASQLISKYDILRHKTHTRSLSTNTRQSNTQSVLKWHQTESKEFRHQAKRHLKPQQQLSKGVEKLIQQFNPRSDTPPDLDRGDSASLGSRNRFRKQNKDILIQKQQECYSYLLKNSTNTRKDEIQTSEDFLNSIFDSQKAYQPQGIKLTGSNNQSDIFHVNGKSDVQKRGKASKPELEIRQLKRGGKKTQTNANSLKEPCWKQ